MVVHAPVLTDSVVVCGSLNYDACASTDLHVRSHGSFKQTLLNNKLAINGTKSSEALQNYIQLLGGDSDLREGDSDLREGDSDLREGDSDW